MKKNFLSKIVIVSNDSRFNNKISKIFSSKKYKIELLDSFDKYATQSKEGPFNLIIFHKSITPAKTKELIKKISKKKNSPPVLAILSRSATAQYQKKLLEAGADFIISEPYPDELLLQYSNTLIEKAKIKLTQKTRTIKENDFAKIVDESPVVFFKWSSEDGHPVEYVSDHVAEYGYTKDDFLNKKLKYEDIIHPEDKERALKEIEHYREKGIFNYEQEYRILTRNKSVKWVRDYTSVIRNSKGKIKFTQGFITDIAENKIYEKAYKDSETKFKALFSAANDGILIMKDSTFIDCNESTLKMFNCKREDIIDADPFRFSPEYQPNGQLSSEMGNKQISQALKGIPQHFEWKHKKLDGTLFDAEVTLNSVEFAGEVYLQAIVRDITERKTAEETIKIQSTYFKQLFEGSPLAICMLNNRDRIININKGFENLFQYTLEEIKGKLLNDLIVPESYHKEASVLSSEALGNEVVHHETVRKRKDGNLIDVSVIGYPININDELIGVYGIYMDITESRKANEALKEGKRKAEEMNRLKSVFLANMSHELRTPLIGIIGYSEILSNELDNPEFKMMAETIRDSSLRLKDTLNSVLDLSRIESNKYELKLENINVSRMVLDSVQLFESIAKKKNLYLKSFVLDTDCILNVDQKALQQIIDNLVNNAIKYTHEGGVTVELERTIHKGNHYVELRVVDTGIGIPDDAKNIIFEEFRQASEGLSRYFEGTGLGLTLTKKFTELLGGEILLNSKVGEGTTFIVRFPDLSNKYSEKDS